jgi:hypothetical protein
MLNYASQNLAVKVFFPVFSQYFLMSLHIILYFFLYLTINFLRARRLPIFLNKTPPSQYFVQSRVSINICWDEFCPSTCQTILFSSLP